MTQLALTACVRGTPAAGPPAACDHARHEHRARGRAGHERVWFRPLLEALSGKTLVTTTEGNHFRYNHLILNFSEDLRRFLGYCIERRGSMRINKEAFGDVLFKIASAVIGNALGYWYIQLKMCGHGEEMSRVDLALAKGVCFR